MRTVRTAIAQLFWVTLLTGCGARGSVTFTIRPPTVALFSPISDRVTEYSLKTTDGQVVGVAADGPGAPDLLPIGPLQPTPQPRDMVLSVLSGAELLGMARLRDVAVRPGATATYVADVRKPLIFVGSALPDETDAGNQLAAGEILDPTSAGDLAKMMPLPDGIAAAAVTSDGRFLIAGRSNGVTVYDTGTGVVIGELPLGFTAARVAVAERDRALAIVERAAGAARVALISDVAAFVQAPKSATPTVVMVDNLAPRAAAFSPDGKRLYVLTGGSTPACGPANPAPNAIVQLGPDGATLGKWPLASFVSDLAVDPQSGAIVVSESQKGAVSTLDQATPDGPAGPTRLFPATCPTALGIRNGEVFVVTEDTDPQFQGAFVLKRGSMKAGPPTALPFAAPFYQVPINDQSTPDMLTNINLTLTAGTLEAYEMAVAPDASRAVFATKARYREVAQKFKLSSFDCTTNADIVEYGLYTLDTRTGNAAYEPRSQLVLTPSPRLDQPCITCDALALGLTLTIKCPAAPGDRPAGVAAVFGTP